MAERELLLRVTAKDFTEQHVRGSGPGGQHRNKTATGVRLTHKASGATAEATEHKSQDQNRRAAFRRCIETKEFQAWLKKRTAEAMGLPSLESIVDQAMDPKNITTQVHDDKGRWITVDPEVLLP